MRVLLLALPWMIACSYADSAAGAEYVDEDFPPTACDTDDATVGCESTGEAPMSCEATGNCSSGVCAASFNGEIGPFECQSECVQTMDDAQWCFDASACCDAEATCDRGYCVVPEGLGTSTLGDSSDGASSTDSGSTDSGSTDSGSTDSGSTDSGSTDSGSTESTGGVQ